MGRPFAKQLPESHHGPIVKLGGGEIGGKARGLGFLAAQLDMFELGPGFAPHRVVVPETTVIATDLFDEFMGSRGLDEVRGRPDEEIRRRFLEAPLAPEAEAALTRFVLGHRGPLAVRSSSLSEDKLDHPFAGVYLTYMLANNAQDVKDRVRQLSAAVRLVWANVLCREPVSYMRAHGVPAEGEKMAVVLQDVVGARRGEHFYPICAGAAHSYNFFPIGSQRAEDGVAAIALGLGKRAVDDQDALRFSPARPTVRPAAARGADLLRAAQKGFYALNMGSGLRELTGTDMDTLDELGMDVAEAHGTLQDLASTYSHQDETLYEGITRDGIRVLTFHRLLRGELFPLPSLLGRLLKVVSEGFGRPVELEFALTLEPHEGGRRGTFHLLQARPMADLSRSGSEELPSVPEDRVLLRSAKAMGHRVIEGLRHVVWVDPAGFDASVAHEAARGVAAWNETLLDQGTPYLLLVPGRLGTRNAALGVPVTFAQVAGAAAMVELATEDFVAEPSQGTHFFHNMVSRGVPFMAVETATGDSVDLAWLRAQPADRRGPALHVEAAPPLRVQVVGTRQQGIVFREGS